MSYEVSFQASPRAFRLWSCESTSRLKDRDAAVRTTMMSCRKLNSSLLVSLLFAKRKCKYWQWQIYRKELDVSLVRAKGQYP